MPKCLQYGAGMDAPGDWINYDASPMIKLQKIPLFGRYIQKKRGFSFPENVLYGDIVKGLPEHNSSCDAVYCSHVLEHLTYDEFLIAIKNTYSLLAPGGVFRLVMPDLKAMCEVYVSSSDIQARAVTFMRQSGLGVGYVRTGLLKRISAAAGNSNHYWLWDYEAVKPLLYQAGFKSVRLCFYHDSDVKEFESVENPDRFNDAFAVEAVR